jgi:3-deoxy-7-phosphoheptulonate synthase
LGTCFSKIESFYGNEDCFGKKAKVTALGRIAGQYAKPRSRLYENDDGVVPLPISRGEIINGYSHNDRDADPTRLLEALSSFCK